jgi:hypothetical protein
VALLGTRNEAVRQSLAGVVCLSSPFLLVRARQLSDLGDAIAKLGVLLSAAAIAVWAVITRSLWVASGLVLGAVVYALIRHLASRVPAFMTLVSPPSVGNLPLLVVRAPDDEASLSLGFMQAGNRLMWLAWRVLALQWIPLLWNVALRVADRVRARTLLEVAGELWIVVLVGSLFLGNLFRRLNVPEYVLVALWVPVVLVAFTMALGAILIIPIGVMNALALLPFGPGFSLFSPFLEVSAESTPPGACTVVQMSWNAQPAIVESGERYELSGTGWMNRAMKNSLDLWSQIRSSTIRLQHSTTYHDPLAIAAVVQWMRERAV